MLLCLFALAHAPVQPAETKVAVSDEGAHAARFRERQRFPVSLLRLLAIGGTRISADVAQGEQMG